MSTRKSAQKRDPIWVTLGPEPFLATCQRCGGHEAKPDLPISLDAMVAYLRYVIEKHRLCPEGSPA